MNDEHNVFFPTLPVKGNETIEQSREGAEILKLEPPLRLTLSRDKKDERALRTVGEVADLLGIPVHVVRFWRARFGEIRPITRPDGRNYYRPQDIILLRGLHRLLHEEGYTIKGAHRLIRKKGADFVRAKGETELAHHDDRLNQVLHGLLSDLEHIQERIKKLVA